MLSAVSGSKAKFWTHQCDGDALPTCNWGCASMVQAYTSYFRRGHLNAANLQWGQCNRVVQAYTSYIRRGHLNAGNLQWGQCIEGSRHTLVTSGEAISMLATCNGGCASSGQAYTSYFRRGHLNAGKLRIEMKYFFLSFKILSEILKIGIVPTLRQHEGLSKVCLRGHSEPRAHQTTRSIQLSQRCPDRRESQHWRPMPT